MSSAPSTHGQRLSRRLWMSQMSRRMLKTFRETALVFIGAAAIIAAIIAISLYLLRNSNEIWAGLGNYDLIFGGGQILILRDSDTSCAMKLDKPDLMLLVVMTSLCVLAWAVFMRWRSSWRRGPQGLFPIQLSKSAAEPIAVVPIGATAVGGAGALGATARVVPAAAPPMRRSKRPYLWLWLCLVSAAVVYLTIVWSHLGEANSPETAKLLLDADESKYLAAEGHQRRGRAFEALASRMDVSSFPRKPFTWSQVQNYLGPPDLYDGPLNQPTAVVYFYDRYAKKDWALINQFDSQGKTKQFLWTTPPLPGWSTYPTTSPATMPDRSRSRSAFLS